jgi:hypothetical protein
VARAWPPGGYLRRRRCSPEATPEGSAPCGRGAGDAARVVTHRPRRRARTPERAHGRDGRSASDELTPIHRRRHRGRIVAVPGLVVKIR